MKRRTNFGYNPFEDIEELFERMSRQFDEMSNQFERSQLSPSSSASSGMMVDVADDETEIIVTADLPGFEKSDIDISVANQALTIRADRDVEAEQESDNGTYVRRERRHESLRRTIPLPGDVRESEASATYSNGVLTVMLPKMDVDDDAHRIDVE